MPTTDRSAADGWFRQLKSDTLIYGVGRILAKSLSFFLLPLYTRVFTPHEYGVINMLVTINGFLGIIMTLGLDSAQSYFFFQQKGNGIRAQAEIVSSILHFRLAWGGVIVICSTAVSPLLNAWLFNGELAVVHFVLAFAGMLMLQAMTQSAEVFRLLFRPWRYIAVTSANTLLTSVVSIACIIGFGMGIRGYFIGFFTGAVTAMLGGWMGVRGYLVVDRVCYRWWKRLIAFGLPLVPASFSMYVTNMADRMFVDRLRGKDELGLYAVAATVVMAIMMVVNVFRQAFWPVAMDVIQAEGAETFFRKVAVIYHGGAVAAVVLFTYAAPGLFVLFTGPTFHQAYPVASLLAWYPVYYGFFMIVGVGIWKRRKTAVVPLLAGTAAVLNIALNAVLVPVAGGAGAAVATSVTFAVWAFAALMTAERLWRVSYPLDVFLLQAVVGAGACAGILLAYRNGHGWLFAGGIACAAVAVLVATVRPYLTVLIGGEKRDDA